MVLYFSFKGNQTTSILADVRAVFGRNSVTSGFKEALVEHNNMYDEYFEADQKSFFDDKGGIVRKPFFWCNNVCGFLELVSNKRGIPLSDCHIQIGGDTGKGFLKITAKITPHDDCPMSPPENKRRKRSDGVGHKFIHSGHRNILLLGVGQDIKESKENIDLLFTWV